MTVSHGLDTIGNKLAASQRVLHAIMSHGNTITNANSREFDRSTAVF